MGSLLGDDGFRVAVVVALVGVGIAWWLTTRGVRPVPVAAVTVVAALVGLRSEHYVTFSLVLGVVLLGLAAWASRAEAGLVIGGIAVVAGAFFVARALPDQVPRWMELVVFVAAVPLVPLVEVWARRWDRIAPLVVLVAVLGVYFCVPDTDFVRPLLAASLVVGLLALLPGGVATQVGTGVVAGLLLWTVGFGGEGRTGALVGGIACVAALALFPALPERRPDAAWWVAVGTTLALVLWCSRVAGLVDSGWLALVIAAPAFVVAAVVRVATGPGRAWFRRARR